MTYLSHRIAALTGADRAIDAEVADVLGWWPEGFTRKCVHGGDRRYKAVRGNFISTEFVDCPRFTASLDATLAEIKRWGWGSWHSLPADSDYCNFCINVKDRGNEFSGIRRDDNLTLAALEALVRAVEAGE